MSAPKTNIEKQRRLHAVPLIGMGLVVLFAAGAIVLLLFGEVERAPERVQSPAAEEAIVDPRPPEVIAPEVPKGVPGGTTAPPSPPPSRQEPQAAD